MSQLELWHEASDGKRLFLRAVLPGGAARAVVHLAHGVGEHSGRYVEVARALSARGFAVYANDHRGHGRTEPDPKDLGFFGPGGADRIVTDLFELMRFEKSRHPGVPFVLLGHSMGSFLAQEFMLRHGAELSAVVLSATSGKPPPIASVGRLLARLERLRVGPRAPSPLLQALSFGAFNKPFKDGGPTQFEWLSRERATIEAYVADPLCGFSPSTELWVELLDLFARASVPSRHAQLPKDLPVYALTGSEDPGNERAKGQRQLVAALQAAGLRDVTSKVYEGGRHEMFNETNRDDVLQELLAWLEAKTASS